MKNVFKRFLLILLSVMTFAFAAAAVGCNEDDGAGDGKATYTITVVDQSGAAVQGAMVIFCTPGQGCEQPILTNAEGKVVSERDGKVWEVHATKSGYTESATKNTATTSESITLVITSNAS